MIDLKYATFLLVFITACSSNSIVELASDPIDSISLPTHLSLGDSLAGIPFDYTAFAKVTVGDSLIFETFFADSAALADAGFSGLIQVGIESLDDKIIGFNWFYSDTTEVQNQALLDSLMMYPRQDSTQHRWESDRSIINWQKQSGSILDQRYRDIWDLVISGTPLTRAETSIVGSRFDLNWNLSEMIRRDMAEISTYGTSHYIEEDLSRICWFILGDEGECTRAYISDIEDGNNPPQEYSSISIDLSHPADSETNQIVLAKKMLTVTLGTPVRTLYRFDLDYELYSWFTTLADIGLTVDPSGKAVIMIEKLSDDNN